MTELCDALHPEDPTVACTKRRPCYGSHTHFAYGGPSVGMTALASWPNPAQPPTQTTRDRHGRNTTPSRSGLLAAAAARTTKERRTGPPTVSRPTRASDPSTSHAAALTTPEKLRQSQADVLALFRAPMTDEELIEEAQASGLKQSASGLRTRRSELVDRGLLFDTGERGLTAHGRQTIKWGRKV